MTKTPKKGRISNVDGVVPVPGYEDKVRDFRFNHELFKRVEKTVKTSKESFRVLAADIVEKSDGDVTAVEFLSDDGSGTVPVRIPDITKESNRTKITPDTHKEAVKLGFDIDDLDVATSETSYTLTGSWAEWFSKVLDAWYREQGLEIWNEREIKETTHTTLTVKGIEKLRKMAREGATDQERKLAELLLENGIKSYAVGVE